MFLPPSPHLPCAVRNSHRADELGGGSARGLLKPRVSSVSGRDYTELPSLGVKLISVHDSESQRETNTLGRVSCPDPPQSTLPPSHLVLMVSLHLGTAGNQARHLPCDPAWLKQHRTAERPPPGPQDTIPPHGLHGKQSNSTLRERASQVLLERPSRPAPMGPSLQSQLFAQLNSGVV